MFVTAQASDEGAQEEHSEEDAACEKHDAQSELCAERGEDDLMEDEGRDEEIDVEFDEAAEIEAEAFVEQPAAAHQNEDGEEDLAEDGPQQHR